jgi:hypothetical protein
MHRVASTLLSAAKKAWTTDTMRDDLLMSRSR